MISRRVSLVFALATLSAFADAKTDETLIMRIFNPNYRPSNDQMLAMLKKADLESYGYKKEITTKLVSTPGSDTPTYQKAYLYYKVVDCSRVKEINQELQTLLPGVYEVELVKKINSEMKARNVTNMKQCKVGLEVHFNTAKACGDKKNNPRRRKRSPCFFYCSGCSWIGAS